MALFDHYTGNPSKWIINPIVISPLNVIAVTWVPTEEILPHPMSDDAFSLLTLKQPVAICFNVDGEPTFSNTLLISGDYRDVSLVLGLDTTGEIRDILNLQEETI